MADAGTNQEEESRSRAGSTRNDTNGEGVKEPIDVSIEIRDSKGHSAKVALSGYGPIRRPLEIHVLRRGDLERSRFVELHEFVFQTFSIPLSDFTQLDPALDLETLNEIRLVFDLSVAGTVVLDDVGIAFLDDAFMAVRMPSNP